MERLISEITKTPGKHVKSSLPIFVRISHSDQSTINLSPTRELRFGLRFLNSYIFATLCRRPLKFQTINFVILNTLSSIWILKGRSFISFYFFQLKKMNLNFFSQLIHKDSECLWKVSSIFKTGSTLKCGFGF